MPLGRNDCNRWNATARYSLVVAVLLHIAILVSGALSNFPVQDEVGHLPAGIYHWRWGRFEMYRVNPPLVRMVAALPVVLFGGEDFDWSKFTPDVGQRPEFLVGQHQLKEYKIRLLHQFVWPRIFCISFSILGVVILYNWVKDSLGVTAAMVAGSLWLSSPTIICQGQTILPDLGATSLGLLACYLYYQSMFCRQLLLWRGVALGLALLSKLTWITALISLPIAALACAYILQNRAKPSAYCKWVVGHFFSIVIAIFILNAGYCFSGFGIPLGDFEFCSRSLGGKGDVPGMLGNRFAGTMLGQVPLPLPKEYVQGVDYLRFELENKYWSFLDGNWKLGGWHSYYLRTILYKTPEATLLAALFGVVVFVVTVARKQASEKLLATVVFMTVPAAVCFGSISSQTGFNHHHRYILSVYPCIFMFSGLVASHFARIAFTWRGDLKNLVCTGVPRGTGMMVAARDWHWTKVVAIVLAGASAFSSACIHPFYTGYFNYTCGGPKNGWRLLGASNVDWGQDIARVDKWIKEHPHCRPLKFDLDYFGLNGDLFGHPSSVPPASSSLESADDLPSEEVEWWIVSVKRLFDPPGYSGLEYLQKIEPVDRIGCAYHVYLIDPSKDSKVSGKN